MSKKPTKDVYSRITEKIIADLEAGVRPWEKPWNAEHAAGRINKPLRHNGHAYSGMNVLMLWSAACDRGFAAPIWMTYRQATEYGGQVRKGEKGELVVYANNLIREEEDPITGEEKKKAIPFLKGYTVFNVEQIDGLPEKYYELAEQVLDPVSRISEAEKFFAATGATINYGGNRAFYAIGPDRIQMPPFECFRDAEAFYSTLCHETIHNADNRIMPCRKLAPLKHMTFQRSGSA
jgi:antirestriction protein ArdC